MVEKKSSNRTDAIPKRPPKRPARDYTNLPQRPITLKQQEGKKQARTAKKTGDKAKSATKQKRKAIPKKALPQVSRKPPNQWVLKGISETTKQYALDEANRQGITIGEWIEQLILNQLQPSSSEQEPSAEIYVSEAREEIVDVLHTIEHRLERIEEQRGFWSRFWDQVMKLSER